MICKYHKEFFVFLVIFISTLKNYSEENRAVYDADFDVNCDPLKVKKSKKLWDCLLCTSQFEKRKLLTEHTQQVHDGKKMKCHMCLQGFTKMANLKRHLKTVHEGKKPFRCLKCHSGFADDSALKIHILLAVKGAYFLFDHPVCMHFKAW